jgi:diguanylate cyclase (GGDEF)-like protein/PAS domain S-box-containing protein
MAKTDGLHKELLDSLFDGVYSVNRKGAITYWNKAAETITGYSESDVLGKDCAEGLLEHVNEKGRSLCHSGCPIKACMRDGKRREMNVYLKRKDGHMLPTLLKVTAVRNERGQIVGGLQCFGDNSSLLAMREKAAELEKMALIDPLTCIGNRRYADISLQNKISELKRYGWPFGVMFIDIDNFKRVNDSYGHAAGDEMLKRVAQEMYSNLRSFDFIFRWGGEEFLVIVTNIDKNRLRKSAERLRTMVQNTRLSLGKDIIQVSISIGGTMTLPEDTEKSIFGRIDAFMYDCKKAGKNKCIIDGVICDSNCKHVSG